VRTKFGLYTAVAALVALGVLLMATTAASAHGKGTRSLKIVATEIQSEYLDLGTAGPSLGDELVFSERLSRHRHQVGMSGVVCTATQVLPPYDVQWFHCVGTLRLRTGQITLQGLIEVQGEDDPGPFVVAITGGTGEYTGAGGVAVVREVRPGKSIYKLRFDAHKQHKPKPRRHRR
jgi:hypothetical protein